MEDLFFELLRVSVGKQDSLSRVPNEEEWKQLADIAYKQFMMGVCFASIQRLSEKGVSPPRDLLLQWATFSEQTKGRNIEKNTECLKLQNKLRQHGMRSCILKGQGNAMMYGKLAPQLEYTRHSGDIDVWAEGGFERVVKFVLKYQPTKKITNRHIEFNVFDDTEVEMHFKPDRLINRIKDRKLQRWLKQEEERQMTHRVDFEGDSLIVPTTDFNMVFLLLHIYRHFFSNAIGLRQITDYFVLLQTNELNEEEKSRVRQLIHSFGLERFASALMWVLGHIFHLEKERMLWAPNESTGRFLLDEVMLMGNFGRTDDRFVRSKEAPHLVRYWQYCKGKMRFLWHFPAETFWLPIDYFVYFFEVKKMRRKGRGLMDDG